MSAIKPEDVRNWKVWQRMGRTNPEMHHLFDLSKVHYSSSWDAHEPGDAYGVDEPLPDLRAVEPDVNATPHAKDDSEPIRMVKEVRVTPDILNNNAIDWHGVALSRMEAAIEFDSDDDDEFFPAGNVDKKYKKLNNAAFLAPVFVPAADAKKPSYVAPGPPKKTTQSVDTTSRSSANALKSSQYHSTPLTDFTTSAPLTFSRSTMGDTEAYSKNSTYQQPAIQAPSHGQSMTDEVVGSRPYSSTPSTINAHKFTPASVATQGRNNGVKEGYPQATQMYSQDTSQYFFEASQAVQKSLAPATPAIAKRSDNQRLFHNPYTTNRVVGKPHLEDLIRRRDRVVRNAEKNADQVAGTPILSRMPQASSEYIDRSSASSTSTSSRAGSAYAQNLHDFQKAQKDNATTSDQSHQSTVSFQTSQNTSTSPGQSLQNVLSFQNPQLPQQRQQGPIHHNRTLSFDGAQNMQAQSLIASASNARSLPEEFHQLTMSDTSRIFNPFAAAQAMFAEPQPQTQQSYRRPSTSMRPAGTQRYQFESPQQTSQVQVAAVDGSRAQEILRPVHQTQQMQVQNMPTKVHRFQTAAQQMAASAQRRVQARYAPLYREDAYRSMLRGCE